MGSTPDHAVRVLALAGDIVSGSWASAPANLTLGVTLRWTSILSKEGIEKLLLTSCYGNPDKLRPDELFGSHIDFTTLLAQLYIIYRLGGPYTKMVPGVPRTVQNIRKIDMLFCFSDCVEEAETSALFSYTRCKYLIGVFKVLRRKQSKNDERLRGIT